MKPTKPTKPKKPKMSKVSKHPETKNSLLNNSMSYLSNYRERQATDLQMRLNLFVKSAVDKYGSIDKIKNDGCSPIDSQRDIMIIEKLIELKTFVTIPVFVQANENTKTISHFYTIGLWYFWGLPEIVITFEQPITQNAEFINIVINVIHDKLYAIYRDKLTPHDNDLNSITRLDFLKEPGRIKLRLNNFNIHFIMKRLEPIHYMENNTPFMLWFYMYYMEAQLDTDKQPKLYPVYQIKLNETQFTHVAEKIMDKLYEATLNQLQDMSLDENKPDELNKNQQHIPTTYQ
jgi:hypothetical protein